jgi:hypothetical protein
LTSQAASGSIRQPFVSGDNDLSILVSDVFEHASYTRVANDLEASTPPA